MFCESLRTINDSTSLQLKLVYSDSENHEGSNLAPLTKEESIVFRHVLVFCFVFIYFCLTCAFFYKQSTNNAQTSNKYVDRKGMGLNCHGLLWAEMAMGRI